MGQTTDLKDRVLNGVSPQASVADRALALSVLAGLWLALVVAGAALVT